MQRVQADRAVGIDAGALLRRRVPHETAILEGQEVPQFRRHRHEDEIGLLAAGDPLRHIVEAAQLVSPFGGRTPMPLTACRQFPHEEADDDEEDLRREVPVATDPERLIGNGQEEVERQGRDQGADCGGGTVATRTRWRP